MRIIGKTHDYYDSAQAYGADRRLVYIRKQDEQEPEGLTGRTGDMLGKLPSYDYWGYRAISCLGHIIGFCGKLYPVFEVTYWDDSRGCEGSRHRRFSCYSGDEIALSFQGYDADKHREFVQDRKSKHISSYEFSKRRIDRFVQEWSGTEHTDPFFLFKTPVFLLSPRNRHNAAKIQFNPCLKDFEFYKVMDAYTAHQEIEMFLGGVLGNKEQDTVGVDDKHLMLQKGFNEWSFKNLPVKKKRRRK